MKILVRVILISAAVFLMASTSFALEPLPVNSGFLLWMVPQAHVYDFGAQMTWKDKVNGRDHSVDTNLDTVLSGGIGIQASYITDVSVFVNLELAYHVYLFDVSKTKFENFEATPRKSDGMVHMQVTDGRENVFVGYYFLPAPFRPYIAVGGGVNQEKFQGFHMTSYLLAYNASGMVGGDFFFARHGAVGVGVRGDYLFGEDFTKTFTRDGVKHEAEAILTRIPLMVYAKIGYMF